MNQHTQFGLYLYFVSWSLLVSAAAVALLIKRETSWRTHHKPDWPAALLLAFGWMWLARWGCLLIAGGVTTACLGARISGSKRVISLILGVIFTFIGLWPVIWTIVRFIRAW